MEDDVSKISQLLSSTVYDQKVWTSDWGSEYSRLVIDDIDQFRKQLLNQAYGRLGATQTAVKEEEPEEPHTISVSTELDQADVEFITAETREIMYRNAVITTGRRGKEETGWCRDNCTDLWMTRYISGGNRATFRFANKDDMLRFMEKFGE